MIILNDTERQQYVDGKDRKDEKHKAQGHF